jgi:hypothetical protein
MTMSRYQIVFSGQTAAGAVREQVQADLARLFRADAARIATLFSGRRIAIKGNLDAAEAEKYRTALARVGALVEVLPEGAPEAAASAPAAADAGRPADSAPVARGRLQVQPRDEYMAAFAAVDAPDFGVAPLGVDLQEARPEPPAPELDLDRFSLAPVGSDMGQAPAKPAGPPPDISHLSLQRS